MTRKLARIFAATAVFATLAAATTALAQNGTPQNGTPSPQSPGTMPMAGAQGGMMNMMGQMDPDHMRQMSRMIQNCNRMMESMLPQKPSKEPAPGSHG
jgi:hypothetical protein